MKRENPKKVKCEQKLKKNNYGNKKSENEQFRKGTSGNCNSGKEDSEKRTKLKREL